MQPGAPDTIIQILAKHAFFDKTVQVFVGGGDDSHIGAARQAGAEFHIFAVLQHPQQFSLQLQRQDTDFIQEKRSLVGLIQITGTIMVCSGKGPFGMAEELGVEQVAVQGGHVDRREGRIGARAGGMDGTCQQFLAGAALPGDEHRKVTGGMQFGLFQDADHFARARYDGLEGRLVLNFRQGVPFIHVQDVQQAFALQCPIDGHGQLFFGNGFDEVVISAFFEAFDRYARLVDGRDHDAFCIRAGVFYNLQ